MRPPWPRYAVSTALLALGACAPSGEEATEAISRYDVRGRIAQAIDRTTSKPSIWLEHEAIPDFVGITGEVEGMDSMVMPFAVADGLDLSGLEVGSKVRFELTVDWSAKVPGRITRIETLPAETALSFESND